VTLQAPAVPVKAARCQVPLRTPGPEPAPPNPSASLSVQRVSRSAALESPRVTGREKEAAGPIFVVLQGQGGGLETAPAPEVAVTAMVLVVPLVVQE